MLLLSEIHDYLIQLEKHYAIFFEPQVKTALISRCRDRQSGGLGNFIEILELMISYVRPKWKDISYQIIEEGGRILHDHMEDIQSYTSIKPSRFDILENEEDENIESVVNAVNVPTTDSRHEYNSPHELRISCPKMQFENPVSRIILNINLHSVIIISTAFD